MVVVIIVVIVIIIIIISFSLIIIIIIIITIIAVITITFAINNTVIIIIIIVIIIIVIVIVIVIVISFIIIVIIIIIIIIIISNSDKFVFLSHCFELKYNHIKTFPFHSLFGGCWWPGYTRSNGIISHGLDSFSLEYLRLSTKSLSGQYHYDQQDIVRCFFQSAFYLFNCSILFHNFTNFPVQESICKPITSRCY